jgi:hypothetical protein
MRANDEKVFASDFFNSIRQEWSFGRFVSTASDCEAPTVPVTISTSQPPPKPQEAHQLIPMSALRSA